MICSASALSVPPCLCAGGTQYQRLSGSLLEGTDRDEVQPWTFNPIRWFWWILSWAIPGMGMFLEAYFIFRRAAAPLRPRLLAELLTQLHCILHPLFASRASRPSLRMLQGLPVISSAHLVILSAHSAAPRDDSNHELAMLLRGRCCILVA